MFIYITTGNDVTQLELFLHNAGSVGSGIGLLREKKTESCLVNYNIEKTVHRRHMKNGLR